MIRRLVCLVATAVLVSAAPATADREFSPLFNGKDLSGWRLGSTSLDGKTETADKRFRAVDDLLHIEGAKEGQPKMEAIDTAREFKGDFDLRLEFRASRDANSGLHLRDHEFKHQLQIRDYPRVGPYKDLKKYKDADWNLIEVSVRGDKAHCTCNGEVLEDALVIPSSGPIGLQSEINVIEYRNVMIRTLD